MFSQDDDKKTDQISRFEKLLCLAFQNTSFVKFVLEVTQCEHEILRLSTTNWRAAKGLSISSDWRRLLLSIMTSCSNGGCWTGSKRDHDIDMIVAIIVSSILFIAVFLCIIFSSGCKSSLVEPSNNFRSSYMRATIVFSKMFQRPAKAVPPPSVQPTWKPPPPKIIDGNRARSRRNLGEISVGMDLTTETKISYSGSIMNNNVVAKGNHLEYCFESAVETTTLFPANSVELMKLKIAYLPTIRESKSSESISNAPNDSRRLRPRVRREIVLFTGPEEKREFLSDGDSSEEDFL